MAYNDMRVATFSSKYHGGDVVLRYCPHDHSYKLWYTVQFRTPGGFCDASAWCAYDAADESQVADLVLDAIDIARTPLMERS